MFTRMLFIPFFAIRAHKSRIYSQKWRHGSTTANKHPFYLLSKQAKAFKQFARSHLYQFIILFHGNGMDAPGAYEIIQ